MNRQELRELTALILNYNNDQTDQNFTDANLNTAIDEVYKEEVNAAILNGYERYFRKVHEFTWTGGELTVALPETLKGQMILSLRNVTNDNVGTEILFSDFGINSIVFWKDNETLQWGTGGPSSDVTVRATYQVTATPLTTDTSTPDVIPAPYHNLLAWAAAVWLRMLSDEAIPPIWDRKLEEYRKSYWKFLTSGRPTSDAPAIRREQDASVGLEIF